MIRLARLIAAVRETAHHMVGLPSYEAYVAHMAAHHPDRPIMDRNGFFRDRQAAHYGGKGGRRCC